MLACVNPRKAEKLAIKNAKRAIEEREEPKITDYVITEKSLR